MPWKRSTIQVLDVCVCACVFEEIWNYFYWFGLRILLLHVFFSSSNGKSYVTFSLVSQMIEWMNNSNNNYIENPFDCIWKKF